MIIRISAIGGTTIIVGVVEVTIDIT